MEPIVFTPPQTVADFMVSDSPFRLIAGPVGSAKTTGCIFELYRRAAEQRPSVIDGLRHTRFAIVRQTLQQLKQTVLKDILQWLPGIATWKVSESTIHISCGDIRSEWMLIPLENIEDQRRLLSSQLTGAWLSEAIEIDAMLVPPIDGRCGRYPDAKMGGCTWKGIIADTNMPEEGSQWHELMELKVPADWLIFKQPGGLSEHAENLQWLNQTPHSLTLPEDDPERIALGRGFYERLARNPNPAWVNRYVHAQYGIDPSGSAVFNTTFHKATHVVRKLVPIPGMMLLLGQDFGRDPCTIITQINYRGQLLCLEEVPADDIGLELHIKRNLRPILNQAKYAGMPVVVVGDPAGKAKDSMYELNSFDLLKSQGFTCFPAPTNDIDARIRAVEGFLIGGVPTNEGMQANLLIDNELCPKLIAAMNGGYRYGRAKPEQGQPGEAKAKPNKNNHSHIADALQYACLGAQAGTLGHIQRHIFKARPSYAHRATVSAAGWT